MSRTNPTGLRNDTSDGRRRGGGGADATGHEATGASCEATGSVAHGAVNGQDPVLAVLGSQMPSNEHALGRGPCIFLPLPATSGYVWVDFLDVPKMSYPQFQVVFVPDTGTKNPTSLRHSVPLRAFRLINGTHRWRWRHGLVLAQRGLPTHAPFRSGKPGRPIPRAEPNEQEPPVLHP